MYLYDESEAHWRSCTPPSPPPLSLFSLSLSLSLSFLSVLSCSPYLSPARALMIADSVSNGDCLYIQTHIHTPAYRHTQAWYLACVRGAHSAVEQVDSLLTLKLSSRRGNKDMATESCPPGVLLLGGEHIVIWLKEKWNLLYSLENLLTFNINGTGL